MDDDQQLQHLDIIHKCSISELEQSNPQRLILLHNHVIPGLNPHDSWTATRQQVCVW